MPMFIIKCSPCIFFLHYYFFFAERKGVHFTSYFSTGSKKNPAKSKRNKLIHSWWNSLRKNFNSDLLEVLDCSESVEHHQKRKMQNYVHIYLYYENNYTDFCCLLKYSLIYMDSFSCSDWVRTIAFHRVLLWMTIRGIT